MSDDDDYGEVAVSAHIAPSVPQDVFEAAYWSYQRACEDVPPGTIAAAAGGWPLRCAIAAAVAAEREAIAAAFDAQARAAIRRGISRINAIEHQFAQSAAARIRARGEIGDD